MRFWPSISAILIAFAAGFAATPQGAWAALSDKATAREATFIAGVTPSLTARYATAADAVAGGFIQLTPVSKDDNTSIYFNMTYTNVDPMHPNFLWYDRRGKLVGLDYEYAMSQWPKPPGMSWYPVLRARWVVIPSHFHYAYRAANGTVVRHGARLRPNISGDPITAAELRADRLLPKGSTLMWAHYHPKTWDLGFWLVPDPAGAFAAKNPNVK
jgi:hypothetical protein